MTHRKPAATRLLEARLPDGRFRFQPGVSITDKRDLAGEVLDILYGPLKPRTGLGHLDVEGPWGLRRIIRDLETGRVRIRHRGGPPPPDPRTQPPGAWLLGSPGDPRLGTETTDGRPVLEGAVSELRAALEVLDHQLQALSTGAPSSGSGRDLLAKAARRVARNRARDLRLATARDAVLEACLEELRTLSRGGVGLPVEAAAALEGGAQALEEQERRERACARPAWRRHISLAAAAALAGAATALLGLASGDPALLGWGCGLAAAAVVPCLMLRAWWARMRRMLARRRPHLEAQAARALAAAGLQAPDGPLDARAVRDAATEGLRRRRLRAVERGLRHVMAGTVERRRRKRRLQLLEGSPGAPSSNRLKEIVREEPVLALSILAAAERPSCGSDAGSRVQRSLAGLRRDLARRLESLEEDLASRQAALPVNAARGPAWALEHRRRGGGWPLFLEVHEGTGPRGFARLVQELAALEVPFPIIVPAPRGARLDRVLGRLPAELRGRVGSLRAGEWGYAAPGRRLRASTHAARL